jgi:hypothetical protein
MVSPKLCSAVKRIVVYGSQGVQGWRVESAERVMRLLLDRKGDEVQITEGVGWGMPLVK